MKKLFLTTILAGTLGVSAVSAQEAPKNDARATLINNQEQSIGIVDIMQAPEGVLLHIDLENLPAGKHGFHIHQVGDCSDEAAFKEAGGHIGKGDSKHGLLNPEGYEEGDLPNLIVPENGKVELELFVDDLEVTAQDDDDKDDADVLLDSDGAAFMIHENADDHMTQPIGGAGARIACGVIKGL